MELTLTTKKRIAEYLGRGKRFDGRSPLDYRKISIKTNVSKLAEGSAEVSIGKTRVIAGVKMSIAEPYPDSEDSGNLMVTTELLPIASEKFESGPPTIFAIELARIIDRGIRESEVIDFKKLCIKKGEKVWAVMIDIYPLNDDGNLIDAAGLAATAALSTAVFPVLKDDKIEYGEFTTKHLPLNKCIPLTLTFYKIGNNMILDPDAREEEASEARLSIALSESEKSKEILINAMQKGGSNESESAPLTKEELFNVFDMAVKEERKLRKIFNEQVKEAKAEK